MTKFENDDWACHCCYMCKDTEQDRIIKLLEGLVYTDEQGHEMIGEFKSDLIALISTPHEPTCYTAQGKWDGGCTCKEEHENRYTGKPAMRDPRQLDVWGKKPQVADRTLNERKYCAIDQYYYSEMFTCPICYGAEQERERIGHILRDRMSILVEDGDMASAELVLLSSLIEEIEKDNR